MAAATTISRAGLGWAQSLSGRSLAIYLPTICLFSDNKDPTSSNATTSKTTSSTAGYPISANMRKLNTHLSALNPPFYFLLSGFFLDNMVSSADLSKLPESANAASGAQRQLNPARRPQRLFLKIRSAMRAVDNKIETSTRIRGYLSDAQFNEFRGMVREKIRQE